MKSSPGIYTPLGIEGYEFCHPIKEDDFEKINIQINGLSRKMSWVPIPVKLIHEDVGQKLASSDSPWLGAHALIFRAKTIEVLGTILQKYGELLPLNCKETGLHIFNPTNVINALDEAASSVIRFNDGRIMVIQRHVFRKDVIGELDIFKISNLRVSPTFFSHYFVDRWKASKLEGLEFKKVWDSQS